MLALATPPSTVGLLRVLSCAATMRTVCPNTAKLPAASGSRVTGPRNCARTLTSAAVLALLCSTRTRWPSLRLVSAAPLSSSAMAGTLLSSNSTPSTITLPKPLTVPSLTNAVYTPVPPLPTPLASVPPPQADSKPKATKAIDSHSSSKAAVLGAGALGRGVWRLLGRSGWGFMVSSCYLVF